MFVSLSHLQILLVAEVWTGSPCPTRLGQIEHLILHHPELGHRVNEHLRKSTRDTSIRAFDPNHKPGILKVVRIQNEAKVRLTYSPDDTDYTQSLYWYLGILLPLAESMLSDHSHAYRPNRNIGTEMKQILMAISGGDHRTVIAQEDVKSCFDNLPIAVIHHLLPSQTREQVMLLQQRYRETIASHGLRPKGGPQGHPAVCALINMAMDFILAAVRQQYKGQAVLINFSDDLTMVGPEHIIRDMRNDAKVALRAHNVTLNPKKSRLTRVELGAKTTILGLELEWMTSTTDPVIRPKQQAYRNLTEKIAAAVHNRSKEAIITSWKAHYNSLCNDPDHQRRTQSAIVEGLRRLFAGTPPTTRPVYGGK